MTTLRPDPVLAIAARPSARAAVAAMRTNAGFATLRIGSDGPDERLVVARIELERGAARLVSSERIELPADPAGRRSAWGVVSAALGERTLAAWAASTYLVPRLADELAAIERRSARTSAPLERRTERPDPLRLALERRAVLDLTLLVRDVAEAFPAEPLGRLVAALAADGGLVWERLWVALRRSGLVGDTPTDLRDAALLALLVPSVARLFPRPPEAPLEA